MSRNSSVFAFIVLASLIAAGCDVGTYAVEQPDVQVQLKPATGDQSVVGLIIDTPLGTNLCSGAVIAPRVVLTAAHCVRDAETVFVGFGPQVLTEEDALGGIADALGGITDAFGGVVSGGVTDAFGTQGGVTDALAPQDAKYTAALDWAIHPDYARLGQEADIAVVQIGVDAPALPLALNDDPALLSRGSAIRAVGFGYSDADAIQLGVKHEAAAQVTQVGAGSYQHAVSLTGGDSGGPTFVQFNGQEYIVGVHARADRVSDAALDARVDTQLAFIDSYLDLWR